ncbi:MAG: ribbon-helix-helix domain-containing protein [Dehalococcoidia bacterium]
MHKTSVYLSDEDKQLLESVARAEGRPQAEIVRDALRAYEAQRHLARIRSFDGLADIPLEQVEAAIREYIGPPPKRRFAAFGAGRGDGTSIADIPEEELLKGFGADSLGDEPREKRRTKANAAP